MAIAGNDGIAGNRTTDTGNRNAGNDGNRNGGGDGNTDGDGNRNADDGSDGSDGNRIDGNAGGDDGNCGIFLLVVILYFSRHPRTALPSSTQSVVTGNRFGDLFRVDTVP